MASSSKAPIKGNKVHLSTFMKWGVNDVIGHKFVEENGSRLVNFIWCTLCAKNKAAILQHPNCKGPVKESVMAYINGTSFVTKHSVMRHISGEGHILAFACEKSKPIGERLPAAITSKANPEKVC